jgi:hypothetical protein
VSSFLFAFLLDCKNTAKVCWILILLFVAAAVGQAPIGQTAPKQTMVHAKIPASAADQFVGSMGINVHMESGSAPYYHENYERISGQLQSLGMRHFRDEMNQADPFFENSGFINEIKAIGTLGYTLTGIIEGGNDYPIKPGQLLEANHVLPMILNLWPTIDSVEGPNEPDNNQFAYGVALLHYPIGAIHESEDLWEIVKHGSIPQCGEIENCDKIKDLPVLAMSEGNADDFKSLENDVTLGTIPPPSEYSDAGNMHAYQGGLVGAGEGPSSGLDWYISLSQLWTGSEPLWTTEMGYHNNTYYLADGEQQGVSEQAAAIYLPAAFLTGFNDGVVRTFSYELINETQYAPLAGCPMTSNPTNPQCEGYGYYGLLHYDLTPKPAFIALQNLIELLQEPGSNFQPGSLNIAFSANPGTNPYRLRYTLLEKSDGDYFLAIWNDISVFDIATCAAWNMNNVCTDPVSGKDIPTNNVPVTIRFSGPQSFTVYAPNDASATNPTSAYTLSTTSTSIEINLPPEVLIIKIAAQS